MLYRDLYRAYANYAGITIKEAQERVGGIADFCKAMLEAGEEVFIPGFIKLYTYVQPPKRGRNPRTGEEVEVPAGIRAKIELSKKFKDYFKSADFEVGE